MEKQEPVWLPKLGHSEDPNHPFNKQWAIFDSRKRILLVCGSRASGKTHACLHRVIRHMWETPGARVAVFAESKGMAKDAGSWQTLIERIMAEWMEGGICTKHGDPIGFTTKDPEGRPGPKTDPLTRAPYFRIRNWWGGESEARLFSITHENDIVGACKNKEFSMIYVIELSLFKSERILSVTLPSLRMAHLRPPKGKPDIYHQWLADTNPDEDLGSRSWFYDVFYRRRLAKRGDSEKDRKARSYYDQMEVIEMFSKDNPYITEDELISLEQSCEGDQALYDSYVLGIHGDGGVKHDKFFSKFWKPEIHVVGGHDGEDDQIDVSPATSVLYGGWDIGSSVNHAAVMLDKRFRDFNGIEKSYWSVLDEVVSINEKIGLGDLTHMFMEKQAAIEKRNSKKYDWIHWADATAINVWRPTSETYDYLEVMAASQDRIRLQGVERPAHSVRARVRILQQLLRENRIYVSSRCVRVIEMMERLRRGVGNQYVEADEWEHVFDALMYPIYMEVRGELWEEALSRPRATKEAESEFISV